MCTFVRPHSAHCVQVLHMYTVSLYPLVYSHVQHESWQLLWSVGWLPLCSLLSLPPWNTCTHLITMWYGRACSPQASATLCDTVVHFVCVQPGSLWSSMFVATENVFRAPPTDKWWPTSLKDSYKRSQIYANVLTHATIQSFHTSWTHSKDQQKHSIAPELPFVFKWPLPMRYCFKPLLFLLKLHSGRCENYDVT
jgi:hypothetical protein